MCVLRDMASRGVMFRCIALPIYIPNVNPLLHCNCNCSRSCSRFNLHPIGLSIHRSYVNHDPFAAVQSVGIHPPTLFPSRRVNRSATRIFKLNRTLCMSTWYVYPHRPTVPLFPFQPCAFQICLETRMHRTIPRSRSAARVDIAAVRFSRVCGFLVASCSGCLGGANDLCEGVMGHAFESADF
jgi:hypothetical protein